jgi:hypothetical protein
MRRYQIVTTSSEVFLIDGDTGNTWRLGQIGDKRETGWMFLPREDPRSTK